MAFLFMAESAGEATLRGNSRDGVATMCAAMLGMY